MDFQLVILAAVLILTVVGFLFVIDRKDKRAHEEREAHRKELQLVLNRLTDPAAVVAETTEYKASTKPHSLPFEDDDAWLKYLDSNQAPTAPYAQYAQLTEAS